ncbi:MAG: CoA transferase [Burkholderiales bacterium]|nr:CoA transferase [Burkholderiales bacterium]
MEANAAQPLAGVKVLELGNMIAAPFCTRILAEFGADVIKIEDPKGGDQLRQWRKMYQGTSLWWLAQARNKKSVSVDMRGSEGQEIVRRLAARCDIVVENFRPGTLERWNLGWEALHALNAGLVMVRLSGYGQTGPYKDRPGFGVIGEAMGGMRYITGYPDTPPVRMGISIGDSIAALYGAIGALVALHHRQVNGGSGQMVDLALYEAVFGVMESLVPEFDVLGFVRERAGNALPGIVPSNTYPTRDGKYVIIGANGDSIFKRLMSAIGRDDLANDPGVATNEGRVPRTEELDAVIGGWTRSHDLAQVLRVLHEAGVPSSKVYDVRDIMSDPHYAARGMVEQFRLADGKGVKLPAIVPKLSATPGRTRWLGPKLGAHTDEVLDEIGYDPQRRSALRAAGVI